MVCKLDCSHVGSTKSVTSTSNKIVQKIAER